MGEIKREITKEEFDRLMAMPYGARSSEIRNSLPDYIICGYGYYGHSLVSRDGKYLIEISIGNSCD